MMLVEETSVPDAALPVDEFKAHLRLGTGFDDGAIQDAVLLSFLRAAMAAIEARTGKVLMARECSWSHSAWRDAAGQALPLSPVTRVSEVKLVDADGDETIIDPRLYRLVADLQRPKLTPRAYSLPRIPQNGTVELRFDAGFADEFGQLPADLAQAVFMLAAHYYEHRSEIGLGEGALPYGVSVLIERYKTVRLLAGGRG